MSDASSSAQSAGGNINFADDSAVKWIIGGLVGVVVLALIGWIVTRKA